MEISPHVVLEITEAAVVPGETARYPFAVQTGGRLPRAAEFAVGADDAGFDPHWARVVRVSDNLGVTRYLLEVTPEHVRRDQYGRYSLVVRGWAAGRDGARCELVIKPGVRLTAKPDLTTWPGGQLTLPIENFAESGVDVDVTLAHHGSSWSQGWDLELAAESGPVTISQEFDPPEGGKGASYTLTVTAAGIPVATAELTGRTPSIRRRNATVLAAVVVSGAVAGTALVLGLSGPAGAPPPHQKHARQVNATQPASPARHGGPGGGNSGGSGGSGGGGSGSGARLSQTITFTSAPPASADPGDTYLVTATGGPSGEPVTFSITGPTPPVCTVTGDTVTFERAGSCEIDANQLGTGRYAAAPEVEQRIVVQSPTP